MAGFAILQPFIGLMADRYTGNATVVSNLMVLDLPFVSFCQ